MPAAVLVEVGAFVWRKSKRRSTTKNTKDTKKKGHQEEGSRFKQKKSFTKRPFCLAPGAFLGVLGVLGVLGG
jgi:hypothetical protein